MKDLLLRVSDDLSELNTKIDDLYHELTIKSTLLENLQQERVELLKAWKEGRIEEIEIYLNVKLGKNEN